MNRIFVAGLLALLASTGCATTMQTTTASGESARTTLFSTYDRVRGVTDVDSWVFYRNSFLGADVEFHAHAFYADTVLRTPLDEVLLVFRSTVGTQTSDWQFLKSNALTLLINGTARIRLEGSHDGSVGTILLKEVLAYRLSTADLLRLASANQVEGAIANWTFALKPEEIAKLRELALFVTMDPNAPMPIKARKVFGG